jgi:PmbA/TldA metallopeptidase C-terminal domain/PmbA/TldA metallopeptidase central domain
MKPVSRLLLGSLAAAVAALSLRAATAPAADDVVLRAMQDELARTTAQLRLGNSAPPYFAAYRVTETTESRVAATFGSVVTTQPVRQRQRLLAVEVRVGSPQLDQTNFVSMAGLMGALAMLSPLPIDDNYTELRRQLWLASDSAYKQAVEQLAKKKASLENKTRADDSGDFSSAAPTQTTEETAPLAVDLRAAEALARELSGGFREFPAVTNSTAAIEMGEHYIRYVNSEGTRYTRRETMVILVVMAVTQAPDGRPSENASIHFARTLEGLPAKAQLLAEVRRLGQQLTAVRAAPLLEDTYNGPVLFANEAAAEVFAQAFAPRLVAAKRAVVENPQLEAALAQFDNPFMDKLGARVLPESFTVVDDATRSEFAGAPLFGSGKVDDEGVPTREVKLVDAGRLKTLLTSRVPSRGLLESSGSRHGGGPAPSNLLVTSSEGLTPEAMKAELLKLVQERGKPYGVIVRQIVRPQFRLQRDQPMAPNRDSSRIEPAILAYKVFPDGHEELLRNVEVSGITASAFKDILAAGNDPLVYHTPFAIFRPGSMPGVELASLAVPSLLFDDVTLKAPSGATPKPPVAKHPFFDRESAL